MAAPFGLEYKSAALGVPVIEHKTAALAEPGMASASGAVLATTDAATLNTWQRKSAEFDLSGDPDGTAWLIVAVTGVRDEVNDIIVPGAFRRTLSERPMKGVKGHDWNRRTAVQRAAMELLPGDPRLPDTLADGATPWPRDAGILLVKCQYLLDTRDGREAWAEVKADEAHAAQSIGYKVTDTGAKIKGGVRYIYDLDVYEWSNVLHGAHPMANALAVKHHHVPDGVDWEAWAALPSVVEGKARNLIRRVVDAAYWGRPVGTIITPGMKPVGPRQRAGARDRGDSDRTAARVQAGVRGGMGRAGLGGLRRDTAAAMAIRKVVQGPRREDIDDERAHAALDVAIGKEQLTREDTLSRLARFNDDELVLAAAMGRNTYYGDELREALGRISEARKEVARREGIEVRDDDDAKTARSRAASSGDVGTAMANLQAFKQRDDARKQSERGYYGDYGRDQNVAAFLDEKRPKLASDDGRVIAAPLSRRRGGDPSDDARWAVIDSRTGDILSEGESTDDVHDFVDGAADRLADQEERDGDTGRDGGAALDDVPAGSAGRDSGGAAGGDVRGAGVRSGGEDRGPGGRAGGPGPSGRGLPDEGGQAGGRGAGGAVDGDSGDGLPGSGAADRATRGRRGAAPGAAGAADGGGTGAAGGDRGVLDGPRRAGGPDGDSADDLAADDAGDAHGEVTAADVPDVDLLTAQRLDDIPPGENFTPGLDTQARAGARAKLADNMAALRLLRALQHNNPQRNATPQEQAVLARWAGWGGLPKVFDALDTTYRAEHDELRGLLSPAEWAEGEKNTLNAHYTDPRVTSAVWDAVRALGGGQGRILEPGAGSGNFIGFAPEGADMVGVELDSTTAGIAKYLYPQAKIRNESFAKSKMPDGSFDGAVGNVPFGRYALLDREDNPGEHSIHNHFIIKTLKKTRPGGVVALLTSRFTMDSMNSAAREEMARYGDLISAVRLPTGSHRKTADTDVIEDVLIFRRREDGAEPLTDQSWTTSARTDDRIGTTGDEEGDTATLNPYWKANPGNVLGEIKVVKGRFGADIRVDGDRDMAALPEVLGRVVRKATDEGLTATARVEALPELIDPDTSRQEGDIRRESDGSFTQAVSGAAVSLDVPKAAQAEFGVLLSIRDAVRHLLQVEAASAEDTDEVGTARARLNTLYDGYVAKYGPVNRFTLTKTGARNVPAAARMFRRDPGSSVVRALETYDPTANGGAGAASKAAVFTKRTAAPRQIATSTDDPADAVTLSLDTYGEINLPAIATMLGVDEATARQRLGSHVFEVPPLRFEEEESIAAAARAARERGDVDIDLSTLGEGVDIAAATGTRGDLVPRAEYLSGNVRRKLDVARVLAARDPRFAANVAELEAVIPRELGTDEIDPRLGAAWIDAATIAQFANELLQLDAGYRYGPKVTVKRLGTTWTVDGPSNGNLATEEWGTPARPLPKLLQAVLEQRPIKITYKDPGTGKTVQDFDATIAAQQKAEALNERFSEWLWEDADRARRLSARYNDQFNNIALRSYADQVRTFPGMTATEGWAPRPHQVAAVNRIVAEPTALLGHVVGAGKTAEMVLGSAELKRLGLARKPAIIVPNHMLEQFTREYLEVYPAAKILAAGTDDLQGDKRDEFIARAGVGDWDAVILTQTAFEAIPMGPEQQKAYIDRELAAMRAAMDEARREMMEKGENPDKDRTIKQMAAAIQSAETAMEKLLAKGAKANGLTFEQTGIDYLFVDEAHHYSNLRTVSRIPNAGATGSGKATDLHMKMEYLRATTESGRVATFATGTPIRNTVTQAYIMMRYLRPDLLEEAGIASFDAWAATFGQIVEEMELKPEGSGFRQTSRFAKFRNVPELLRIMHTFSDIKLAEDLKLPTPNLVGGKVETVAVPGSPELRQYIRELGHRADLVRSGGVEPEDDNMLSISMDGRKAALSMALVKGPDGLPMEHQPGKIEAAADRIGSIWESTKDREYPVDAKNPDAGTDPNKGGLQIVFLDLGTPNSDGRYDAYDTLRSELAARGMDPKRIRFMHEAKNDAEKAQLFAAARGGQIDVLIGSSEKMGVGTNVQKRAVALHHLDAPWRPADVEQRDGRIMRQGNLNPDVEIVRYVTEGSFDAYMWQTLERKARFIGQIMKGSLDVREIEDIGDTAMSYAEVKALATGNMDLLAKSKVDALRTKLDRLSRTHARTQTNLRTDIGRHTEFVEQATADVEKLAHAARVARPVAAENGTVTFDGVTYENRAAAADAIRAAAVPLFDELRWHTGRRATRAIGAIGGHTLTATYETRVSGPRLILRLDGVPGDAAYLTQADLGAKGNGLILRVENFLRDLEPARQRKLDAIANSRREIELMTARVGQGFLKQRELDAATAKSARLNLKMRRDARRTELLGEGWNREKLDNDERSQFTGEGLDALLGEDVTDEQRALTDLRWNPAIDTAVNDDPILGTDDAPAVDVTPADLPVTPTVETVPDTPSPREVTSPEGEVVDDVTDVAGPQISAAVMDAARADADAALVDGDRAALAVALEKMGVDRDSGRDELADALMVLDEDTQRRRLDQIELLNAADTEQSTVLATQRSRTVAPPVPAVDEGADTELDPDTVAAAAALGGEPGVPQNALGWATGSASNDPATGAPEPGGGPGDNGGAGTSRSWGRQGPTRNAEPGVQIRPDVRMAMGQGGTAPTPESSRARTNRINAALAAVDGGHGGAGSRRVKDGSVHYVSADDNPDAIARAVEAVARLGWAGMVVYPTLSGTDYAGNARKTIEVRVPDIGADGHPLRTFSTPDAERAADAERVERARGEVDEPTGTAFDARDGFDSGTGTVYSTTPTPALITARDSLVRQAAAMDRTGNTVLAEKMRANVAGYDAEIALRPDAPAAETSTGDEPLRPDLVPGNDLVGGPGAPPLTDSRGRPREPYQDKPGAMRVALAEDQRYLGELRFEDLMSGRQDEDDLNGAYVSLDGQALLVHDKAAALGEVDNAIEIIDDNLNPPGQPKLPRGQERSRYETERRKWGQIRRRIDSAVPDGFRVGDDAPGGPATAEDIAPAEIADALMGRPAAREPINRPAPLTPVLDRGFREREDPMPGASTAERVEEIERVERELRISRERARRTGTDNFDRELYLVQRRDDIRAHLDRITADPDQGDLFDAPTPVDVGVRPDAIDGEFAADSGGYNRQDLQRAVDKGNRVDAVAAIEKLGYAGDAAEDQYIRLTHRDDWVGEIDRMFTEAHARSGYVDTSRDVPLEQTRGRDGSDVAQSMWESRPEHATDLAAGIDDDQVPGALSELTYLDRGEHTHTAAIEILTERQEELDQRMRREMRAEWEAAQAQGRPASVQAIAALADGSIREWLRTIEPLDTETLMELDAELTRPGATPDGAHQAVRNILANRSREQDTSGGVELDRADLDAAAAINLEPDVPAAPAAELPGGLTPGDRPDTYQSEDGRFTVDPGRDPGTFMVVDTMMPRGVLGYGTERYGLVVRGDLDAVAERMRRVREGTDPDVVAHTRGWTMGAGRPGWRLAMRTAGTPSRRRNAPAPKAVVMFAVDPDGNMWTSGAPDESTRDRIEPGEINAYADKLAEVPDGDLQKLSGLQLPMLNRGALARTREDVAAVPDVEPDRSLPDADELTSVPGYEGGGSPVRDYAIPADEPERTPLVDRMGVGSNAPDEPERPALVDRMGDSANAPQPSTAEPESDEPESTGGGSFDLPLDGPMRNLLVAEGVDGATVDGSTLTVTDADALGRWLDGEAASDARAGDARKRKRAAIRLRAALDDHLEDEREDEPEPDEVAEPATDATPAADEAPDPDAPQPVMFDRNDDGENDAPSMADQDGSDPAEEEGETGGEPLDESAPPLDGGPSMADQDGAEPSADEGEPLPGDGEPLDDGAVLDEQGEPLDPAAAAAEAEGAAGPGPDQAMLAADTLAEAEQVEADALGLIVADDGEIEVTPDVAERQSRVEGLLSRADAGQLDIAGTGDEELTDGRRDLVDELRLQEALHRRDLQRRRERAAERRAQEQAFAQQQQAAVDGGVTDEGQDEAGGAPTPPAPAAPTPEPAPKRRPGLAGSVEDLADAVEGGDPDAVMAAVRRARTSLARSGGGTAQHDELAALLADEATPLNPARLRELASALRENARGARNARARARRLAKRIERDRLRSLVGQFDAELRNRGRTPEDFGGAVPQPGPSEEDIAAELGPEDGPDAGGSAVGGDPGSPVERPVPDPDGRAGQQSSGVDQGREAAAPPSFDRADPDGPAGQARTTELVDGLITQPWRMVGNADRVLGDGAEAQVERRKAAARSAFAPVLDAFGPDVRRRSNEDVDQAARQARAQMRRMQHGYASDMAAVTFAMLLPTARRKPFLDAMRTAVGDYKKALAGRR